MEEEGGVEPTELSNVGAGEGTSSGSVTRTVF